MTRIRSRRSSRIQDRRGQRGGGGGLGLPGLGRGGGLGRAGRGGGVRLPMRPGRAGAGGLLGMLVIAAIIFLPRLLDSGASTNPSGNQAGVDSPDGAGAVCETELEQILCGATDDVAEFWIEEFPEAFDGEYTETQTVFFSGSTTTGCGAASAQTGPFYCPADQLVYFDLDFLVQLQEQFGATGDLATQYIVAHEYGHHVQQLTGQNEAVQRASGETQRQLSIALELQADCYAGVWANDADARGMLEPGEISEALNAAAAVGDDAIQMRTQGRVTEENWTHGSSQQREQWFRRGYETGDPAQCDTFAEW